MIEFQNENLNTGPKIILAGASGYVGRSLIPMLLERFPNVHITALSRLAHKSKDPRVEWKLCDLFSLQSLKEACPGNVDLAFYLVHSMAPTAKLDQGSFADYDLLLADNFARVMKDSNAKHLIYLGGLIPQSQNLSLHLKSRLEMEEIFKRYGLPITVFRAGLILGEEGSSFQILLKLVKRLPVMICPKWTQTLTTPVDLNTVLSSILDSTNGEEHLGRIYDLCGSKPITYIDMMRQTAKKLGKKRFFFAVPFFTPTLSRLWVSLITSTPKNLVYPLIESLECEMLARKTHMFTRKEALGTYEDLIKTMVLKTYPSSTLFLFRTERKTVRSVQRFPLPNKSNAEWASNYYFHWLGIILKPLVESKFDKNGECASLYFLKILMLRIKLNSTMSDPDRQVLSIISGALLAKNKHGFMEFRTVLTRQYLLIAIYDYIPALPWFVYRHTQAIFHLFIMKLFERELVKITNQVRIRS